MSKLHLLKIPAAIIWASPIGIFIGLLNGGIDKLNIGHTCPECGYHDAIEIGGFSASSVGFIVLGVFIALAACMYAIFVAKKENRIYYISATIGVVLICMSSITLTVGIMLLVLPIAARGGTAVWTLSKPKTNTGNSTLK